MRDVAQNYLFVGTSSPTLESSRVLPCPVFDLQNPGAGPLLSFNTEGIGTNCVHASVTFLSLGGADGKIRLFDPSLRSAGVQHTLEAHSGGVNSLSVLEDGSTMVSCGYSARAINPYDPNSPVTVWNFKLIKS
jgi:WD40 repeat protein